MSIPIHIMRLLAEQHNIIQEDKHMAIHNLQGLSCRHHHQSDTTAKHNLQGPSWGNISKHVHDSLCLLQVLVKNHQDLIQAQALILCPIGVLYQEVILLILTRFTIHKGNEKIILSCFFWIWASMTCINITSVYNMRIWFLSSKGQKRPQGNDDNRKSKKPRFDTIESSVEKDDSKIFVDPVLIEKRFNIW